MFKINTMYFLINIYIEIVNAINAKEGYFRIKLYN